MPLSPGSRIGAYEVIAPLGAGGMGEVYRARDQKLNRDVALKILPESFAGDPDRLMRFEREARTLASLNHPQIAQIYGLEEGAVSSPDATAAASSSSIRALVMELVDGEDLAARIANGPMALEEALPIARQIVEALEAAHSAGIIHRDLKPANIKLRPDGTVKVLDFGLAKPGAAGAGSRSSAEPLNSPTITSPAMTMQGVILGTAAYMSPEQAKGKPVDRRADIWAFGCVWFEMLTGRRAFEGDDVTETLAAVIRGEPEWSALPSTLPPALTTVIKRCLERDVRRRISDMSVVRFVLEEHDALTPRRQEVVTARGVDVQSQIDQAVAHARQRWMRRRLVPVTVLLAAVVGALAYAAARLATPAPVPPVMRFSVTPQERQFGTLVRTMSAISPDGSQIVYFSSGRAYLRRLSDFQEQAIAAPDLGRTAISPAFAPDGNSVMFFSGAERAVKRLDIRGGTPQRICAVPIPASFGMTWDASGILVGAGAEGIVRCNPAGGPPEYLATVQSGEEASSPSLLPDGDGLLFAIAQGTDGTQWDTAQIVVQSLRTGERKTIVSGGSDPRYVPTGHLLYTQTGSLYAVPFDPAAREMRGNAVPVIQGIRRSGGSTHLSISSTGVVAYLPGSLGPVAERQVGIADRGGTIEALPLPAANYTHVRASRDGSQLAIGTVNGEQGIVWTYPLTGGAALQRLIAEGDNRYPIWSPDGVSVAFQSHRGGQGGIYRRRIDGTGAIEQLTTAAAGELHIPESWSPDGRHIAFAVRKGSQYSLSTISLDDKRITGFETAPSLEPPGAQFSPDGKWIVFTRAPDNDLTSPDRGVFVRPFPAGASVYQVPRQMIDFHPVWTRNGKEIIFVASTTAAQMAAVSVEAGPGITFGAPTRFPTRVTGDRLSPLPRVFDVLPDGRLVGVITEDQDRRSVIEIRVIVNWFDELRAQVN